MGSEINVAQPASVNFGFLDSPATTSATTYKVQMRVTGSTHFWDKATHGPL